MVSSASQSTMSAIWPSDMTAAPRAEFSATSGGRRGDQLALAEEGGDGDGQGAAEPRTTTA